MVNFQLTATKIVSILVCFLYFESSYAQLIVNAGVGQAVCQGDSATLGASPTASGGTPNYSYLWTPAAGLNSTTDANPKAAPSVTTTYTLVVTDGALATNSDVVTITVNPLPVLTVSQDTTIDEGDTASLFAAGAVSYSWSPNYQIDNPNSPTPSVNPLTDIMYTVAGTDILGCTSSNSIQIIVIQNIVIKIYNTFTPDENGVNDKWVIENITDYPNNNLLVYNRWGKLVYEKQGYDSSWDGKFFGNNLPAGVYFYILDLGIGEELLKGTVTIIRKLGDE